MKVYMTAQISGMRDGKPWPAPGEPIEVPSEEGETLVRNGLASEKKLKGKSKVETATTADDDTEDATDNVDLSKMNVADLKAYAEANGIDLGDASKKADILAAIQAAEA